MYNGLPKNYLRKFPEYIQKRRHWTVMVLYDNIITAFILSKDERNNEMRISSVKHTVSKGIKSGRIVNSLKASRIMAYLLKSVSEEAGIKDDRVMVGLDTPPLLLTPKQWSDDSCLKSPCNETTYRRILHNIIRESSYDSRHIMEIIPLKIAIGERQVEDPHGITGQISMDNILVSLSDQDRKDFEKSLRRIRYRCEGFFSGFHNLCAAFSEVAVENEHVLLVDLKLNSTDVIMFQGDQPLGMKCINQGLDRIVTESLSSILNIEKSDALACLEKYYQNFSDKDAEIIGKNELPACTMGLKCWEMHEIIMGQLKNFIEMEGGIGRLVTRLQRDLRNGPRKIIITGEGACIPGIEELFENRIHIRTETKKWISPHADGRMHTTAYGLALTIAHDTGATILHY